MKKELLTEDELKQALRTAVEAAGGAKKWLRANKITGKDHILHMVSDGRAATLPDILRVLGYRPVTLFECVPESGK
jgi:hypothetical protein